MFLRVLYLRCSENLFLIYPRCVSLCYVGVVCSILSSGGGFQEQGLARVEEERHLGQPGRLQSQESG